MSKIPYFDAQPAPPEAGRFGWSHRHVGNADVICLAGELDHDAAAELRRRLMSVAASSAAVTIVLDLAEVSFIDAGCIRVIVELRTRGDKKLEVDGLHGIPEKVFQILGL
ncbi:STAS domain-containing protein [Paractinoplanes rishiriensis]|uniref:STAS domain-containing protein n=1 Tax=Paractinoplanes rishiriensis TaxID=1050105 RepID=A0A919K809_9ACTN|nr:STAS domain-containing protein [Actinoplanes rishiriensis]GIF00453.1 hypothetical protein Ari01nite_79170 [Actinoplanes rishiriensis]